MKKIIGIVLALTITGVIFCQEINWFPYSFENETWDISGFENEYIIIFLSPGNCIITQVFDNNKKVEDGFVYIEDSNNSQKPLYLLEGQNILIASGYYLYGFLYQSTLIYEGISNWLEFKAEKLATPNGEDDIRGFTLYETGINKITASSYLKETINGKVISYTPDFFIDKIFLQHTHDTFNIWHYDSYTAPWVEGVKGHGIGEWLDVEFKYKSDEIQILNGFVDFRRMNLYLDNSRVKRVLIESENPKFSKEYNLEDIVKYNVIQLPEKTDKIRITIKDVYPGRKRDDTCISSILITNPDLPPREKQLKENMTYLKNQQIWQNKDGTTVWQAIETYTNEAKNRQR